MAENESEMAGFSLADLAGIDVSDIEEVRFSSLEPGAYGFEINEADLGEDEKDGNRRFFARFDMKVVEVKTILTPGIDKESQLGKAHTERYYIDPSKPEDEVKKSIGRIRAFLTDIGLNSAGPLGDVVRSAKSHVFVGKIVQQTDKDDKSIKYARLKLDPPKK
jgi:hypothetical protein